MSEYSQRTKHYRNRIKIFLKNKITCTHLCLVLQLLANMLLSNQALPWLVLRHLRHLSSISWRAYSVWHNTPHLNKKNQASMF